jgi:hypothetical protein
MMNQADNVQTTNRRDRGCTAAQKHCLRQPFSLMQLMCWCPAIGLKTDDDADRHPEDTRQENQDQDTFDGGNQTHDGSLLRGRSSDSKRPGCSIRVNVLA